MRFHAFIHPPPPQPMTTEVWQRANDIAEAQGHCTSVPVSHEELSALHAEATAMVEWRMRMGMPDPPPLKDGALGNYGGVDVVVEPSRPRLKQKFHGRTDDSRRAIAYALSDEVWGLGMTECFVQGCDGRIRPQRTEQMTYLCNGGFFRGGPVHEYTFEGLANLHPDPRIHTP